MFNVLCKRTGMVPKCPVSQVVIYCHIKRAILMVYGPIIQRRRSHLWEAITEATVRAGCGGLWREVTNCGHVFSSALFSSSSRYINLANVFWCIVSSPLVWKRA